VQQLPHVRTLGFGSDKQSADIIQEVWSGARPSCLERHPFRDKKTIGTKQKRKGLSLQGQASTMHMDTLRMFGPA
jgi:hypothetical protein